MGGTGGSWRRPRRGVLVSEMEGMELSLSEPVPCKAPIHEGGLQGLSSARGGEKHKKVLACHGQREQGVCKAMVGRANCSPAAGTSAPSTAFAAGTPQPWQGACATVVGLAPEAPRPLSPLPTTPQGAPGIPNPPVPRQGTRIDATTGRRDTAEPPQRGLISPALAGSSVFKPPFALPKVFSTHLPVGCLRPALAG